MRNAISLSALFPVQLRILDLLKQIKLISTRQRGLTTICIIQIKLTLMSYMAEILLLLDLSLFIKF